MSTQLHLHLSLVVPDGTALHRVLPALVGRELTGVPGSWIASAEPLDLGDGEGCDPDDFDEVLQAEADADAGLSG